MLGDAVPDAPDFARLYAGPGLPMSPRMASRLWAAAVILADTYEGRVHLLKRNLPPIVQRVVDEVWMDRFVSCFDALAVLPREVGDATDGRTTDRAVHPVMVVAMQPVRKCPCPV